MKNKYEFKNTIYNLILMFKIIFKNCPYYFFCTIGSAIIESFSSMISILFLGYIVSYIESGKSILNVLYLLFFISMLNFIVYLVNTVLENKVFPRNSMLLNEAITNLIIDKIHEIDYEKYDDTSYYNLLLGAIQQSDSRALAILNSISSFISNVLLSGTMITIIMYDFKIITLVFLEVFLTVFIYYKNSKYQYKKYDKTLILYRYMNYIRNIFSNQRNIKDLKLYNNFSSVLKNKYKKTTKEFIKIYEIYFKKIFKINTVKCFLTECIQIVIIICLIINVKNGDISLSLFITSINGVSRLKSSLISLIMIFPSMYEHSIFLNDFFSFLNTSSNVDNIDGISIDSIDSLEMKNIFFGYKERKAPVLKDVCISLKKGEQIALVGRNGSGKSSLIKVLCRFYKIWEGDYYINNMSVNGINTYSIRDRISIVFQEIDFYSMSIIENVLMRDIQNKKQDEEIVKEALNRVGLLDKVNSLPQGLYTNLSKNFDDDGTYFSGGEYQKLLIARAYLKNADIYIFDEPSSSLDAIAEKNVFDCASTCLKGKSIIYITHRLSNVKGVDRIYFLEDGEIKSEGTHNQLLYENEHYRELFYSQSDN